MLFFNLGTQIKIFSILIFLCRHVVFFLNLHYVKLKSHYINLSKSNCTNGSAPSPCIEISLNFETPRKKGDAKSTPF